MPPALKGFDNKVIVPLRQRLKHAVVLDGLAIGGLIGHIVRWVGDHEVCLHVAHEQINGVGVGGIAAHHPVLAQRPHIARLHEATIFGTASAGKHDFLRERGVQHPIDYRQHDFVREIERLTDGAGVHIALDSIGGRSWMRSYRTLAPGGRLVICGVTALTPGLRRSLWGLVKFALGVPWLALNPVRLANDTRGVLGVNLGRLWDQDALLRGWAGQMLAYHAAGQVRVHVDRVFPLAEAAAAHRYIQERRSVGKVVLRP